MGLGVVRCLVAELWVVVVAATMVLAVGPCPYSFGGCMYFRPTIAANGSVVCVVDVCEV